MIQKGIGIYRENSADPKEKLYMLVMNILFVLISSFVLIYGASVCIIENLSDLNTSTNSIIVLMAGCCGLGCYVGIRVNLKSSQKMFALLQHMVDESKKKKMKIIVLLWEN